MRKVQQGKKQPLMAMKVMVGRNFAKPNITKTGENGCPEGTQVKERNDGREPTTPKTRKAKKATVITIDDNSPDPIPWVRYRDNQKGINILLYSDSKEHIMNPCTWPSDSEIYAAQQLLKL